MKKHQIHKDFEARFGDKLFQKSLDYIPTEQDLYDATEIFNKNIFNNKLNVDNIEILCKTYQNKNKGTSCIGNYKKNTAKYLIIIYKYETGDSFYQIMNILAHELIHIYDYEFGEIHKIILKHYEEALSGVYVTNMNKHQYVGSENYNAHGKFFMSVANKFNRFGFDVTEYSNLNSIKSMKKIKEARQKNIQSIEKYDFFYETEDSKNILMYKALKNAFEYIIAPGKKFVYRNANEWFFEIP